MSGKPEEQEQLLKSLFIRSKVYSLKRQNEKELNKKARMIKQRDDPRHPFEPLLCRRSIEILEDLPERKEFHTRNQDLLKKKLNFQSASYEPQGPFTPQITQFGASQPSSTIQQLSYGDSLRKKILLQTLLTEQESSLSKTCTFKPTLTDNPLFERVESKINIDTVLSDVKREMERRAKQKELLEMQRVQEEMRECKFKPEINKDAPEYVKRIAEEYRKVKLSQGREEREGVIGGKENVKVWR